MFDHIPYPQLKKACKNFSISAVGGREDLILKLQDFLEKNPYKIQELEQFKIAEKKPLPKTQAEKPKLLIDFSEVQKEMPKVGVNQKQLEIDSLIAELNDKLLYGKATARYNPHTECIELRGGARRATDLTIHQPKSAIKLFAERYIQKAIVNQGFLEKREEAESEDELLAQLRGLDVRKLKALLESTNFVENQYV